MTISHMTLGNEPGSYLCEALPDHPTQLYITLTVNEICINTSDI